MVVGSIPGGMEETAKAFALRIELQYNVLQLVIRKFTGLQQGTLCLLLEKNTQRNLHGIYTKFKTVGFYRTDLCAGLARVSHQGDGMIAQGFGFTRDFLKKRNNSAYFRLKKIPCGFKEQAGARHPGEKCGLERSEMGFDRLDFVSRRLHELDNLFDCEITHP